MKFVTYITGKINKASKQESHALWSHISISTKELYFFERGMEANGIDTYVRGLDTKTILVDGYTFKIGYDHNRRESFTTVTTPDGLTFEVSEPKYRNQRTVTVRFFVGE